MMKPKVVCIFAHPNDEAFDPSGWTKSKDSKLIPVILACPGSVIDSGVATLPRMTNNLLDLGFDWRLEFGNWNL